MILPDLLVVVIAAVLLLVLMRLQRKASPRFRTIPALSRLYRAIGLSVEDGTRLLIGLGNTSLLTRSAGAPLAGLGMLRRLTERTSLSDRPPVAVAGEAPLALLAQDTLEAGYQGAGAGEYYQPTNGRLAGLTPFSAAAGTIPMLGDEDVSAAVFMGHFGVESALLADAAERANAFAVGSSDDLAGQTVWFASAPETLIGEELFAASAYISGTPEQIASISVQDVLRWVIIGALLLGSGAKLLGLF
ncbi:MAG TPA: DUF6754 domain-containing protein [Anaerolineales bacterium]|nr:DUF6754 domain-containing protein [Anaerolineales bacterium]